MNKFYDPNDAANWLKKGKILIHPTEGVWGIGCDAFNAAAVKKINSLKQREASKSLILLASSISDALRYFQPLSEQKIKFLETVWPGHTTVIYNKNKLIPRYLNKANNTIALRVSNHKPIKDLLAIFNNLMVSTSANISNLPTPVNQEEVMKIFTDPDVAIYCFENGGSLKPSAIIDLNTMNYIRE